MEQLLQQMTNTDKRQLAINIIYNDKSSSNKILREYIMNYHYEDIIVNNEEDIIVKELLIKKSLTKRLDNIFEDYFDKLHSAFIGHDEDIEINPNIDADVSDYIEGVIYLNKQIKKILSADNINSYIDIKLFKKIIKHYEDANMTIRSYNFSDDFKISNLKLTKAIKMLLTNPNLNENIKNSSQYYNVFLFTPYILLFFIKKSIEYFFIKKIPPRKFIYKKCSIKCSFKCSFKCS